MSIQGSSPVFEGRASILPTTRIASSSAPETAAAVPAATTSVSPWGALLNKLGQLHQRDPQAFKQVVGRMSDTVKARAFAATDEERTHLAKLAEQLAQTAKTGEMSVFKPTHHHHRAPSHAAGGSPSILQTLLDQVDHVLGPGATPATTSG